MATRIDWNCLLKMLLLACFKLLPDSAGTQFTACITTQLASKSLIFTSGIIYVNLQSSSLCIGALTMSKRPAQKYFNENNTTVTVPLPDVIIAQKSHYPPGNHHTIIKLLGNRLLAII